MMLPRGMGVPKSHPSAPQGGSPTLSGCSSGHRGAAPQGAGAPQLQGMFPDPIFVPLTLHPKPTWVVPGLRALPNPFQMLPDPSLRPQNPLQMPPGLGRSPTPYPQWPKPPRGTIPSPKPVPPRGGEDAAHPCRAGGAPAGCGCPGRRRCRCAASRPRAPSPAPRRAPWPAAASACTCASCTGWGGHPAPPQNPSTSPSPAPETFKAYHLKAT